MGFPGVVNLGGELYSRTIPYYWNPDTLAYEVARQGATSVTGGSGGGDASAANQTTEITKLTSIDGKLPALGQALAAGSVPVVLTAAQLAALTPLSSVSVSNLPATQPVSGTVTANAGSGTMAVSGPLTDTQLRATPVPVSGTFYQATQPVSLASVPSHAVTNAGTFAVQVTSAPTTAVTGPLTDTQLRASPVPVAGTFFQATQPVSIAATVAVSGPLTDTQLRASAVPVSGTFWQATQPVSLASVPSHPVTNAGTFAVQVTSAPTTAVTGTFWQATQPVSAASLPLPTGAATEATLSALLSASGGSTATYKGRVNTFRTPGRAGTTGQKLFALHNATGSTKVVTVTLVTIDLVCTVVKAVTVLPPVIRVYRVTVLPTNGTALTKVARDSSLASSSSVTVFGDASADGTSAATALTATLPANNVLTQEFAPRLITAAGYEMFDRVEFFGDTTITLRALEGIVVMLDYTLATQNPTTDMWIVGCEWEEA